MPCCAFAAFVLGQLVLALAALRRVVLGRRMEAGAVGLSRNAVVEWRLATPSSPPAYAASTAAACRLRPAWPWRFLVVGALEVMLLVGGIYAARAHSAAGHDPRAQSAHASPVCTSH